MLPEIRNERPLPVFTPQRWQTVLLRNYGMVANARLAKVLGTTEKTVETEAARLGIADIPYEPAFAKLGYINIIKNNWHLLPYEQLLTMLDMDEETLAYCLKEDDFLAVKLGFYKVKAEPVLYAPLSPADAAATEELSAVIRAARLPHYDKPFDFYGDKLPRLTEGGHGRADFDRIVYSYSLLYGDTFMEEGDVLPDDLLAGLQAVGVNGIWMQGLLSKLSPYPFVPGLDEGYEIRRKNLTRMIEKCKKYGIGIYLYFNEPRGIAPSRRTKEHEAITGRLFEGSWSLCTETQPVRDYLYTAVKDLCTAVPDLAGIITITMSENMTNCHSRPNNTCPHCKDKKTRDVVPEINNIMQRALTDAGVKTRLLANLWAWTETFHWTDEDILYGIRKMDPKIDILSVSELGHIQKEDGLFQVEEYALSQVGPCEETKRALTYAKKSGHKPMAKVQVNNSWEMAVVPYVPVFELVLEHMRNLSKLDVGGLMLSWTVGGYPTPALDLVNCCFEDGFSYTDWLRRTFGAQGETVGRAVHHFSEGFRHYPYSIVSLYNGAQEMGPANLLYASPTGYPATMVTFPHDDYRTWCGNKTPDEFRAALDALLAKWDRGLALLHGESGNQAFTELCRYAEVVSVNMRSMAVQIDYNRKKEEGTDRAGIRALLDEEERLAARLYALAAADARVGYEASNHYYFTENTFLEKFINLHELKKYWQ